MKESMNVNFVKGTVAICPHLFSGYAYRHWSGIHSLAFWKKKPNQASYMCI
jgi:hypothetical protein